ncbi:hypothetical protein ACHAW6_008013 [Cyclotella cf. meneghiniana]
MAYTQAPIQTDLFMEIPYGIETTKGNTKDYVLQILANVHGQKQAGRVWNQYLVRKLESIEFTQSQINKCLFCRDDSKLMMEFSWDHPMINDPISSGSYQNKAFKLRIKDIQPTTLELKSNDSQMAPIYLPTNPH